MKLTTLFLVLIPCLATGEILRLSKVVPEAGDGITKYEYASGESKQIVFIEDKSIVTDADVAFATPSLTQENSIDVSLTEEGGRKMSDATAPMKPAVDRIAILIQGKLKTVPVLQSVPLGKNFMINGLNEKDEPETLAGLITGKSPEQIRKEKAKSEERLRNMPARPAPVYHTDEEYAALAKEREKIGLNFMDRIYTGEEIGKLLSPGVKRKQIEAIFGKPFQVSPKDDGITELTFQTASERLPMDNKQRMESFIVKMKDNKFSSWSPQMWSARPREPKPLERKPGNLIIKSPSIDMASQDFDLIVYAEGLKISLKPGADAPLLSDYADLISLLHSLSTAASDAQTIDYQCDVIVFSSKKIPEVAALADKKPEAGIPLSALGKAVEPYILGTKTLR